MLKFGQLIGFFLIYLSVHGQKAAYYKSASCDLNKYNNFYLINAPLDAHAISSPYIKKADFTMEQNNYFMLYNELSLKNLTIIDGESEHGTILVDLYEAMAFHNDVLTPKGYKVKKLKSNHLIIDLKDGNTKELVWRGWIDLKKIKAKSDYSRYQKAVSLILLNLTIDPVISE